MRRRFIPILALAMLPAFAPAQQPPHALVSEPPAETDQRAAQIQAATANGIASLRDQVLGTKIARDETVRDFLDRAKSTDDLNSVLESARPVGGPRWVDDNICQVKLELPAPSVSDFLLSVAQDDAKHAGIKPNVLKAKLADWKALKFTGVGSSAEGDAIERARPRSAPGKWSEVSESARRKAISAARADAIQQAIKSIGPVMLNAKTPASDALARPGIAQHLGGWINRQPVTKIEFQDDLKVSVAVAVSSRSLAAAVKSAVASDAAFNRDAAIDWPKVTTQIESLPGSFAGTATAVIEPVASNLPTIALPLTPPEWVDQELDAEGTASSGGSRLKVGLVAQTSAEENIRGQLLQLHIDANTTLGEAAKSDPHLSQAIDKAMKHTRAGRVDYFADGSVRVRISLNLRDAWDELRAGE
jgi:hypothetical protein